MTADDLVKQEMVQELLAYGFGESKKPYYTIRESLSNPDPRVVDEVREVFGVSWLELSTAAAKHCDLDRKYFPNN